MESSSSFRARYLREIDRLGLDEAMRPSDGMVSGSDVAEEKFLDRLRSLERGATWRDVFPDLPAHWDLDDPESWTHPYRPMFAFDYQALPAGTSGRDVGRVLARRERTLGTRGQLLAR